MIARNRFTPTLTIIALVMALAPATALAGDNSFSSVVKHIKSNYKAKQQGFFGMVMFARLAVKVVRPAGVKNFKVAMLRDLDYSRGPRPGHGEFHSFIRSKIDPIWSPLVQYSSPRERKWTYVYALQEKENVKVLVVTLQQEQAFVFQTKFSPEKLIEFMNEPKIMGVSLKGEQPPKDYQPADEADSDDEDDEEKPPVKTRPPAANQN
ncbi:MAG TPA: hypothetical protein VNI02_21900 [Blastocatellia bacterium]|jgi:hypothetical protein|nr:hypothetical protein [Blastocatellia bacterium]